MPLLRDNDQSEAEYIGGIIKRVGIFDPEEFADSLEHRIRFQKIVYLIQAFDIDLGHSFSWYMHGVYSPALADTGYALVDAYDSVTETKFSNPETEDVFSYFLEFIEEPKHDTERLEILSSLHYLRQRNPKLDKDLLISWLLNEKDLDATVEDCQSEWSYMGEYGLIQ
jgi:uncharacterized protein YwgA